MDIRCILMSIGFVGVSRWAEDGLLKNGAYPKIDLLNILGRLVEGVMGKQNKCPYCDGKMIYNIEHMVKYRLNIPYCENCGYSNKLDWELLDEGV